MGKKDDVSNQFLDALEFRGVKRRDFLKFCGATAAILGLTELHVPKIAAALENASKKPSVVWINFASCSGCTEAFAKATYPGPADVILDAISLEYNETLSAAAGKQVEEILEEQKKKGGYILVVEGGIPTKKGFGFIGKNEMQDEFKQMASSAAAILAIGCCATDGGVPAGKPNPAEIIGVGPAMKKFGIDKPLVNLDLCPVHPEYLVGVIVNYLLVGKLPDLDSLGRPVMYYGHNIHDNCERRAHFDAGRFVEKFGSKQEADMWCLYKMGCKGPETNSLCPKIQYNGKVSWCIKAGGPCLGCAERNWVDKYAGFYQPLPNVKIPGLKGVEFGADAIGAVAAVATVAGVAVHTAMTSATGRFKGHDDGGDK